jgi:hypothetical protein
MYDVFYYSVRGGIAVRQPGFDRDVGLKYLETVADSLTRSEYAVACRKDARGGQIIDPYDIAPADPLPTANPVDPED